MNPNTIFKKLADELIEEIILRDAFQIFAEEKLEAIKVSSKYYELEQD